MFSGFVLKALTFLTGIGLEGIVNKVVGFLEHKASEQTEREKLKTQVTVEMIKAAIEDSKAQARLAEKKLEYRAFWVLVYAFVVPLALWWDAVLLDSIFGFEWDVANLPTPELREWATDMIKWIFYTGVGVAGLRALVK